MAKRKPEPKPANPMRTTEQHMQRDRELFARDVASSISGYKNAPKAFKAEQEEKRTHIVESLKVLWSDFDRIEREKTGETINGASNKTEWAKTHKISMRYCQYILNGRKPRTGEHANRAVRLKPGMRVKIDDRKISLTEAMIAALIGLIEEPIKKDPVVATKSTQGANAKVTPTKKTHQISHTGVSGNVYVYCGKATGGKYGIPKDRIVSDVPTCKQCQTAMDKKIAHEEGRKTRHELQLALGLSDLSEVPMGDAKAVLDKFEAAVAAHPEWRAGIVASCRTQLEAQVRTDEQTAPPGEELSPAAKALAAVVDPICETKE